MWQSICDEVKKIDEEHWGKKNENTLRNIIGNTRANKIPKVKNLKFLLNVHTQKRVKTKHVLLIIFHPIDFLIMLYTFVPWAESISNSRHINMHYPIY
jgi:hypothetical protein